ncbi:calcium-binding mitochondrial carrier protein SCaMC-3-like [Centruroides sculpturatus]|uniref:calcium-binding mitochondrial carrier protein SCaMC-3-like n=1 Tax=Centruroides sculpturatus TaxID=218467 RepID=UPI000C6D8682|nr:calcium-binding mitochondrial carrier protein SCaMC-3-like [Centruroides sculpturatus]
MSPVGEKTHERIITHPPHYYQELPSQQEERLEKLFKQLDVDGDGRINIKDLTKSFQKLGVPYDSNHVQRFFEKSDLAKSGHVDFAEFVHYVIEHEKRLMVVFKSLDENKDGKIDKNEIMNAFERLGILIEEQEALKLLKRMDKDGNLTITFDEWRDYLLFHPSSELRDIIKYWRHATFVDIGEDTLVPDDFTETEMQTGMWWRHLVAGGVAGAVSRTGTAPLDRLKVFLQVRGSEFSSISTCLRHMLNEGGIKSLWRGNGINVVKIAPESAIKFMAYEQTKRIIKGNRARELSIYERFMAGSIAGGISQTVIYPMEVRGSEFSSISTCLRHMLNEGGIKSLWRGNGINVVKIAPESAIKFMAYEQTKRIIKGNRARELSIYERFMAGSIAGGISQTVIYPMEVLKTRLALRKTGQYSGIWDAATKIYRHEGMRSFYRGYIPNLLGIIPYAGIDLAIYETLKKMYLRRHSLEEDPGVLVLLACGTISSSCGQVASYPLALVRTRLQAQTERQENSMLSLFRTIVQREGFMGLYRGITPNFMKVAPAVSISYVVYEHARRALGVSMT